ncbi:hypothetical protein JOB18_037456 [Solea senegalensis]|uniref:Uncharacterized protein n=1 Tax=Solea senegalensis TaxID=28829 RepID=A0AAV6R260_SOLSE|nr:hypothetical protein JOB18_037456 [Solea senegalensis]
MTARAARGCRSIVIYTYENNRERSEESSLLLSTQSEAALADKSVALEERASSIRLHRDTYLHDNSGVRTPGSSALVIWAPRPPQHHHHHHHHHETLITLKSTTSQTLRTRQDSLTQHAV